MSTGCLLSLLAVGVYWVCTALPSKMVSAERGQRTASDLCSARTGRERRYRAAVDAQGGGGGGVGVAEVHIHVMRGAERREG